jgi:hypothetical protein
MNRNRDRRAEEVRQCEELDEQLAAAHQEVVDVGVRAVERGAGLVGWYH